MKYVGNSLRGDIDIILSSIVQNRTFENADKNVMQYVDEKLKSTPEFQKQVADFKNQLEEEQEFMSNITNNIFKLNSTDSNKAYDDFKKQKEKGKDFIETKIKEGIPYAEARKQWLHTLDPFKQKIEEFTLSKSEKLNIKPMNFATPNGVYQYAFSYSISDEQTRYIYVAIQPGATSANGFEMKNAASSVMRVPYPEKSVQIAGSGALLSLAGDRQLGLVARGGVDTAYVNLYKVKSSEINHLISQTYNIFAENMEFKSWAFGVYDMSVVFKKRISFANTSKTATNYAALDLGDYLDRTYGDNTGIFIIQTGTTENAAEYSDKRLILLTDLGIIRKVNLDASSIVFVSNLGAGTPASDVEISVLGRNGNAVWAGRTDENGRADIPALPWSE